MSDAIRALVERVLAGEAAAWRELWARAEPVVRDVAGRSGRRASPGEDVRRSVVVATMARLEAEDFRRLRLFAEDAARRDEARGDDARFVAWLATVATRVAIDLARGRAASERAGARSEAIDPSNDPPDRGAADVERRATARSVLLRARIDLTKNQFDALLGWLVGDDPASIAARLDLADEREAERLVRAGIKRLRDRYRRDDGEEGVES